MLIYINSIKRLKDLQKVWTKLLWWRIYHFLGELRSTLFVPQRMKIQDKVEFEGNFRFFILHNKFWIFISREEIPKFNVLCLEKYADQTSWYTCLCLIGRNLQLIKYLKEGESVFVSSKKFYSQNFSCQKSLLLLGAGIGEVFWYFLFGYWLCNYSDLLFVAINICS